MLAKPRSYMNESGGRVKAVLGFYKVTPEQLIVVHDELDIPFGTVRLKVGGGAGRPQRRPLARRGARHARTTPGCGSASGARPAGWSRPTSCCATSAAAERKELPLLIERGADAVVTLLRQGLAAAQNLFHSNA